MEEEEAQRLAEMEADNMSGGGGGDDSDLYEVEEAEVQEICERKRTRVE